MNTKTLHCLVCILAAAASVHVTAFAQSTALEQSVTQDKVIDAAAMKMPDAIAPDVAGIAGLVPLIASRPVINRGLTLDEAVAIALRESPVVRGAVAEVEAAAGQLHTAQAERKPWLSANLFLSGGSISNTVESPQTVQPSMIMNLPRGGYFDQNLMLMYPLFTAGRLAATVRQAAAAHAVSQAEAEEQRQDVVLVTRIAYREVLARRAMVEVWQTRLKEDEEQLRLDRVRSEEGKIPPFYVQRGEAEVAETQQQLTNAQRDVELSLVQLKTVMGIHLASQVEVLDTLSYQPSTKFLAELTSATPMLSTEAPTSPPTTTAAQLSPESVRTDLTATARGLPADLAALLRLAERQRPALRAAGQRIRAAQAAEKAIDSAYGPQVNAFVMGDIGKSRFSGRFGGTTFGVVASLPIFNGGQKSARLQTAQAERRLQEAEQEKVVLQIVQEVSNALLNLRAAEQNIQTAQAALKSAGEDYRVARLRYEAGKSTVVEALDARAAQIRAKSNVIQALYSYNVARDQLLRATGI